jgi:hypothetical protein
MSSDVRIRKNVSNLNVGEKDKFVNAVLALKETPRRIHPGDSSKNRYDDYVEIHHHSMMVMSPTDPQIPSRMISYNIQCMLPSIGIVLVLLTNLYQKSDYIISLRRT